MITRQIDVTKISFAKPKILVLYFQYYYLELLKRDSINGAEYNYNQKPYEILQIRTKY